MTSRSLPAMGTVVTITVRGGWGSDADRACAWFDAVERACSRFDPASELMQLVQSPGRSAVVSEVLYRAVAFAVALAHETSGAFDPSVGGAMLARGFDRHYRSGARVAAAARDLDPRATYRDIHCDARSRRITLRRAVMLDLGAVAKGLAVDLAAHELGGRDGFLVDAGGDLFAGGTRRADEPWRIGIRNPFAPRQIIEVVDASNRAVCTSAMYERPGHIVDARRRGVTRIAGIAGEDALASATILAPSAMVADAVATAAIALGRDGAQQLCDRIGVDALLYAA